MIGNSVVRAALAAALVVPLSSALAQKTGVVKIGVNETLSGAFVSVGLPPATAIRLAVKEINDKGGVRVGGSAYRLQLVEIDNRSETPAAVAAMTKLIEDEKVKFVFGPTVSNIANQAQEVSVPAKVIHISAAGSWQSLGFLSDPKKPLLFGTQMPLPRIAKIEIDGLKQLGAKKVAYISADDDTTKGNIGPFLEEAKAAGIPVVTILFPPKTADFSSYVSRAKGENVDVIFMLQPQALAPDIVRTVVELNASPKGFAGRNINPNVALKTAIGKPLDIPYFVALGAPSFDYPANARIKAYTDKIKAMADVGPNGNFSLYAYDFVYMLAEAMRRAGTVTDTMKIGQALSSFTYDGVAGKVCFGKALRTATYDGGQLFVRNGKVESKAFPSDCK